MLRMRTTGLLLCLAARSHMTLQLMTAFPPSETVAAYSWAQASLHGPSAMPCTPSKTCIAAPLIPISVSLDQSPKIPNT